MYEVPQSRCAVFLTPEGAKQLGYLGDLFVRDNSVLDCESVETRDVHYLEAKVLPQKPPYVGPMHLLLPHHFVGHVVLNDPRKEMGFIKNGA